MRKRKATKPEQYILNEYRAWSEHFWCAGFLSPTKKTVGDFLDWLEAKTISRRDPNDIQELDDYEVDFLNMLDKIKAEREKERAKPKA